MPTTKQGHLRERSTQDVLVPKTIDTLVKDSARNQALSASLQVLIEQNALGFTPFVTIDNYAIGEVVFYDRKLWTFTSAHTAGAWTGNDVAEFSIKDYINVFKTYVDDNYAKKEGEYDLLIAGRSKNFVGEPIPITTGYTLKATGYDPSQPELEFADGQVNMTEIQGRAVGWNQLLSNRTDFTETTAQVEVSYSNRVYTLNGTPSANTMIQGSSQVMTGKFIAGHKYYLRGTILGINLQVEGGISATPKLSAIGGTDVIATVNSVTGGAIWCNAYMRVGTTFNNAKFSIDIIDLTLLNPTLAAKADLTVAEVEAYIASIRTPKPYYARNAGTLLGAKMLGWQLRKTANLLDPTTKQAKLFEYAYTGNDNEYTVNGWDELTNAALQFTPYATGVAEAVTLDANNRFVIPSAGVLEVVASGGDLTGDVSRVCVIATWDGSMDEEVVAYEQDNVEIDSASIYLDSAGTQQAFPNGILKAAPSVADRLYFDEVSKKWVADIKVDSRAYTSGDESDATVITDKTNTWYALTTPETHTNLYYKVGNNEYVPMEEVFPNGIQGLCCNWASENLVEQAEDAQGQPQSITPITTEVFQSDYKELLKTIGDTYVSKEQEKDNFDNLLSVLNTNSATALGGTYSTDGFNDDGSIKFAFTPTT